MSNRRPIARALSRRSLPRNLGPSSGDYKASRVSDASRCRASRLPRCPNDPDRIHRRRASVRPGRAIKTRRIRHGASAFDLSPPRNAAESAPASAQNSGKTTGRCYKSRRFVPTLSVLSRSASVSLDCSRRKIAFLAARRCGGPVGRLGGRTKRRCQWVERLSSEYGWRRTHDFGCRNDLSGPRGRGERRRLS